MLLTIFALVFYFLLGTVALAWVAIPSLRAPMRLGVRRGLYLFLPLFTRLKSLQLRKAFHFRAQIWSAVQYASFCIRFYKFEGAFAAVVIVAVPLGALAWSHWNTLETFDHTDNYVKDERIAALLAGEKLVPPAPLPPEVFLTREVTQIRPLARYESRDWMLLEEEFRQRVLLVFRIMREKHGYEMVLLEGYRTPERQAQLASLGSSVTQAGAGRSYHQYGLAVDSAFLRDGKVVISEKDPWAMRGYELYGKTAADLGLTWGGNWKTLLDYGHVEWRKPGVMRPPGAVPINGK